MFRLIFDMGLGAACALLLLLLGYRLIEAVFFMIGFQIGKARTPKPTIGIDPVLLKQGVEEIVAKILEERVVNPSGGPLNTKPDPTVNVNPTG